MGIAKTSDGRYYVYYQFRSKQQKEYFGKSPQDKAKAEQKDLFLKLLRKQGKKIFEDFIENERKDKATTNLSQSEPINLDRLAQEYVNHLKRKQTSRSYFLKIQHLFNDVVLPSYAQDSKPVNDLTYLEVITWFDKFTITNNYTQQTRSLYLSIMNAVFNYGIKAQLTSNNPLKNEKIPRSYKLNFKLTLPDLRKIIQHAAPHVGWAIEVAYETAARFGPSELFKLEWEDLDPINNTLHIRGTKTPSSDRIIPITQKFQQKLLQVRNVGLFYGFTKHLAPVLKKHPTHIIFCSRTRKQINQGIHLGFKAACERAQIPYNVRPYDVRHLSISQMLANGGNLKAISEIAGHSNIATTAKYLHTLQNEKERSINQREGL